MLQIYTGTSSNYLNPLFFYDIFRIFQLTSGAGLNLNAIHIDISLESGKSYMWLVEICDNNMEEVNMAIFMNNIVFSIP